MKRPFLYMMITVLILLFTYSSAFAETLTGCLKPDGKIVRVKVGTEPKKPCKKKWTQINWALGLNPGTAAGDLLTWDGANWVAAQPSLALDDKMQPWLGVNYIIATTGLFPSRSSSNPFIAEVVMFSGNFAPRGWAFCDGQLLPIAQNTALFSILGTTYGGDGRSTFGLPDLRGRVPVGPRQGPGLTNRRLGRIGGTETHQ